MLISIKEQLINHQNQMNSKQFCSVCVISIVWFLEEKNSVLKAGLEVIISMMVT